MPGLFKFDFYCKDWFADTRDLSAAAKGIYIDLLVAIYARGTPLPADERELCRLTGCATVRSLRPLLVELITKGKMKLVNDHITNGRAEEELAQYETRRSISNRGGQARRNRAEEARSEHVPPQYVGNTSGTQAETQADIVENQ